VKTAGIAFGLGLAVLLSASGHAADTPLGFSDKARQAEFETLLEELRCLVCQNQSLADSHADLAQDLRQEVYRMLDEGRSRAEVLEFMVARYGDFVLYRPPVKNTTWLLWGAPLLLLVGVAVVWRRAQSRTLADTEQALTADDEKKLAVLLGRETPHARDRS
jgi:cytochrome c-type biogenesis protein CcmH